MGLFSWNFGQPDFIKMLEEQAKTTIAGLEALTAFVENPSRQAGEQISHLEKKADELRRTLIDQLNRTFFTPLDREDIFALSRAIDDMIDYASSTAEEMLLFNVSANDYMKQMAQALYSAAKDINCAVKLIRIDPKEATEHLIRAKKTENLVEHVYREALVDLFRGNDVVEILKTREIYRHLSNSADRGDEAANIIGDILVKTT